MNSIRWPEDMTVEELPWQLKRLAHGIGRRIDLSARRS